MPQATLHGSAGIAVPTLVSTLAISCVFTSVVFLEGPAKYLFTPLGLAVVFAMLASYALSRTLTPITIGLAAQGRASRLRRWRRAGRFARFYHAFERGFERMREGYARAAQSAARRGKFIVPVVAVLVLALGARDVHLRRPRLLSRRSTAARSSCMSARPPGRASKPPRASSRRSRTRSARSFPESDRELIVDNIGLPARAYNLAFTDGSTIGVNDGVILVALKEGHAPTADYVRKLREVLPAAFPEVMFYFQAADIVTQILNFGLPAQIDVRTVGYDRGNNLRVANELQQRIAAIPGIADAHLQQEVDAPGLPSRLSTARARAARAQRQCDRQQHQCQPELLGAGRAQFLDRSRHRHSLLHRGADAASTG